MTDDAWQLISDVEPPREGFFLVWGNHVPQIAWPYEAARFWEARKEHFPTHLSSRCFTHWRPMTLPKVVK